jgi:hypothetical protein
MSGIPEFLLSDRITIGKDSVEIRYYTTEEVSKEMSFLTKLFRGSNICDITNNKNKDLYEQASSVTRERRLKPCFPPLQYMMG